MRIVLKLFAWVAAVSALELLATALLGIRLDSWRTYAGMVCMGLSGITSILVIQL